jgi:hypothetical protein
VLDRVTVPAGRESGAITFKMFRHPYCLARLATLVGEYRVEQYRAKLGDRLDTLFSEVWSTVWHHRWYRDGRSCVRERGNRLYWFDLPP